MKKTFFKMMLILTVIVSVFIILSITTNASSNGKCGDNITWTFDDGGTLTISGIGDMYDYSNAGDVPWYSSKSEIKQIKINDGVTSIGVNAFWQCTSLKTVIISDSVISIGNYAFSGCYELTSVTMPDSITEIGKEAFRNCYVLTDIVIPSGVTSIYGYTFYSCGNLSNITIPDSVTIIEKNAFGNCVALTDIYYEGSPYAWENISVSTGNDFLINAKLNLMCGENLVWVLDNNGVLTISGNGAMWDYRNTGDIDIPWYLEIENITSVVIKSGVTSIGKYAFFNCQRISNITIPDSVTNINEYAFYWCKNLTNIVLPNSIKNIEKNTFNSCWGLISITLPNSITSIGNSAFSRCSALTNITIPDSVTSIGNNAFSGCTSLTSIAIPDNITSIGNSAFSGCSALTNITIPDSVTSIGNNAFYECTSLTSIAIPDSITSIGTSVFYGCSSLGEIYWNVQNIPSIDSAVFGKVGANVDGITIIFGEKVEVIPDYFCNNSNVIKIIISNSVMRIGNYAFKGCSALTNITIPDSVTSIGNNAFYGCTNLKSLIIGENLIDIGANAFSFCTYLEKIYWNAKNVEDFEYSDNLFLSAGKNGEGIDIIFGSNVKKIPNSLFNTSYYSDSFAKIKSVTISASVIEIGSDAFYACTGLTDVYYLASEEDWNNIIIGKYNTPLINATIHYAITKIQVSYDANGGGNKLQTVKVITNTEFIISEDIISRIGHTFLGWATLADATTAQYQPGDTISVGTEDITLYAVWEKTSYTSTSIIQGSGYQIYQVALTGIPTGSMTTIACYNDGKLTHTESRNDTNTTFMVLNSIVYDEVKVFVWDGFSNLMPITEAEDVI